MAVLSHERNLCKVLKIERKRRNATEWLNNGVTSKFLLNKKYLLSADRTNGRLFC